MPEHRINYVDDLGRRFHQWMDGTEADVDAAIRTLKKGGYNTMAVHTTDDKPSEYTMPDHIKPIHISDAEMSIHRMGRKARYDGRGIDDCPFLNPINIREWQLGWMHQDKIERRAND